MGKCHEMRGIHDNFTHIGIRFVNCDYSVVYQALNSYPAARKQSYAGGWPPSCHYTEQHHCCIRMGWLASFGFSPTLLPRAEMHEMTRQNFTYGCLSDHFSFRLFGLCRSGYGHPVATDNHLAGAGDWFPTLIADYAADVE